MNLITLENKQFELFLTPSQIDEAVTKIASQIDIDLSGKPTVFLVILNGSFMFAADLLKKIESKCEVSFIKLSSYRGSASTGTVKEILGLEIDITGKPVIVLEDIADTGTTLQHLLNSLMGKNPKSIKVATLLFKPTIFKGVNPPDYIGIEIPDEYVVGYGMDYKNSGRNFAGIYKLTR